jgi:hypothetical protein
MGFDAVSPARAKSGVRPVGIADGLERRPRDRGKIATDFSANPILTISG